MVRGELVLDEERQRRLAITLVRNQLFGVKENTDDYIRLKSGRLSPHYLNIRDGLADYPVRHGIAQAMVDLARAHTGDHLRIGVNHVVGSPEAMTSYAASMADILQMGLLQPRVATQKTTGNKAPVLGRYQPGDRVAAFDDVVTDGETKIATVRSLEEAELEVADYYVLLDREEGGTPQVAEATGLDVTPALGVSSLVRLLHAEGELNSRQWDNVARYLDEYGEPHARETIHTV